MSLNFWGQEIDAPEIIIIATSVRKMYASSLISSIFWILNILLQIYVILQ